MYEFLTGPMLWLSFAIFFIGCIVRLVMYFRGLSWQMDRVAYREHMNYGVKGAVRSILFWLIPFGTRSWRVNPFFTIIFFVFHVGLILTPIFLVAHNIILKERWGFRLWTMSETTTDMLTIAVLVAALFLVLRRIAMPEVRLLTNPYDYLVLLIATAPFITGLMAFHLAPPSYDFWLYLHIITGEIMLIAIPFTKLSHFVLFFASRAQLGADYGIKRGGMKGRSFPW